MKRYGGNVVGGRMTVKGHSFRMLLPSSVHSHRKQTNLADETQFAYREVRVIATKVYDCFYDYCDY